CAFAVPTAPGVPSAFTEQVVSLLTPLALLPSQIVVAVAPGRRPPSSQTLKHCARRRRASTHRLHPLDNPQAGAPTIQPKIQRYHRPRTVQRGEVGARSP